MKLLTGVILSIALIGSIAAFAACGDTDEDCTHDNLTKVAAVDATTESEGNIEYWYCKDCGKYFSDSAATKEISKDSTVIAKLTDDNEDNGNNDLVVGGTIAYQYQSLCEGHGIWALLTLYENGTCECYGKGDRGTFIYDGTWTDAVDRDDIRSVTVTYSSVTLSSGTVAYSYSYTGEENIYGEIIFSPMTCPMYYSSDMIFDGCDGTSTEITGTFWTDYDEWYESVLSTDTETATTLVVFSTEDEDVTATFTDDNNFVIEATNGMKTSGTWSYEDGVLTLDIGESSAELSEVTINEDGSASFTYAHQYVDSGATKTLICDDISALASGSAEAATAVATFTSDVKDSDGNAYVATLYDDGSCVIDHAYYSTDATWSYSNGTFSVLQNGTTALTTTIDTTAGTATISASFLGTDYVFTCNDITGITG